MSKDTIIILGGSGFLGRTLAKWFSGQGWGVVNLCRKAALIERAEVVLRDGETLGPWTEQLEAAKAVINLATRSVNYRYNEKNRTAMMASRMDSALVLGQAIAACQQPPATWLNSRTATIDGRNRAQR